MGNTTKRGEKKNKSAVSTYECNVCAGEALKISSLSYVCTWRKNSQMFYFNGAKAAVIRLCGDMMPRAKLSA